MRQTIQEWLRYASYSMFGPTTVHLQYEAYLVVSLTLLTVSSLKGLYRSSAFTNTGDYIYLLLTFLCLSRHLVVRWLCTWDPSTYESPTWTGILSRFMTTHLTGGQVFDRPSTISLSQTGGSSKGAPSLGVDESTASSLRQLFPSSLLYASRCVEVKVITPLISTWRWLRRGRDTQYATNDYRSRSYHRTTGSSASSSGIVGSGGLSANAATGSNNTSGSSHSSVLGGSEGHVVQRFMSRVFQWELSMWVNYGPTLQFILPFLCFGLSLWYLYRVLQGPGYYEPSWNLLAMDTRSRSAIREDGQASKPRGSYQWKTHPGWFNVFFVMGLSGLWLSTVVFWRVLLPIPDQTAGGNVITDVRQGAKVVSSSTKSSKAKTAKDQPDQPWTERARSIASENRLRLTLQVVVLRVLEYVVLCGILPRTNYICRATGQCSAGASIWRLSKILHPLGITKAHRADSFMPFDYMEWDIPSLLWTAAGVVIVSTTVLCAQAVMLNKAYLAIMGYVASEWTEIEPSQVPSGTTPTAWDPRRKYKKGELIVYAPHGMKQSRIYKATSNSPEGKPFDQKLQTANDIMRMELGHSSTSGVLCYVSFVQLFCLAFYIAVWVLRMFRGYHTSGFVFAVLAQLVAAHAVLTVSATNHRKLSRLNAEIMQSVQSVQ